MELHNKTKEVWRKVYKEGGKLLYPHERAVAFLAINFPSLEENSKKNAFDLGFGGGRHIKLLSDYEFNVYGIDYNEKIVEICKERFKNHRNVKDLSNKDFITYNKKEFFDALIALGVVFTADKKEMKKMLRNIASLLTDDGIAMVDFRTKDDWLNKKGDKIDSNTYNLGDEAGIYKGANYGFYDIDELEEILKECGLKIIRKERVELWKNEATERHSWWITHLKRI